MLRSFVFIGSLIVLLSLCGVARAFTSFNPPLTGGTDFVTGAPTCAASLGDAGPVGLGFDAGHLFTTDYCDHTTYRFPLTGGDFSSPEASADNGLTHGIAVAGGHYYGLAGDHSNIALGLYAFDPASLAIVGPLIASFNDFGGPLAVVADPSSPDPTNPDLFVSRSDGIFRIQSPNSAAVVTQFASGNFDGVCFSGDGSRLYGAEVTTQHVLGFDRNGTVVLDVDLSNHGPDGLAVVNDHTVIGGIDVSNNVFVNSNDGTVERIDVNDGNAVSVVANGGSRGDFATVGPDGCFYVTQADRIVRLQPCFFTTTTTTTVGAGDCGDGIAGVICLSMQTLADPLCGGETINPKLARFIAKKLRRDHALLAKAASMQKPKVRARLLKAVRADLTAIQAKIAKAVRKGKLSAACAETIGAAITAVQQVLVGVS